MARDSAAISTSNITLKSSINAFANNREKLYTVKNRLAIIIEQLGGFCGSEVECASDNKQTGVGTVHDGQIGRLVNDLIIMADTAQIISQQVQTLAKNTGALDALPDSPQEKSKCAFNPLPGDEFFGFSDTIFNLRSVNSKYNRAILSGLKTIAHELGTVVSYVRGSRPENAAHCEVDDQQSLVASLYDTAEDVALVIDQLMYYTGDLEIALDVVVEWDDEDMPEPAKKSFSKVPPFPGGLIERAPASEPFCDVSDKPAI